MSALTSTAGWHTQDRRKTAAAFIASVLIHLLLILLIAWLLANRPALPPPKPEEPAVEITLLNSPPAQRAEPQYVETSEAQRADRPPENPAFESDKDTHAASPLPATGDAPVPTMDGEESPTLSMENREYTPGREARPAPPPVPPARTETARQESTPPEPESESLPKPRTSSPIALLEPPKPKTEPKPEEARPEEKKPAEPAQPAQPSAPGYQPQTRITRIRGNISNRGRASVAANATPLGRYKKILADAIGSRWYYYVNEQMGLLEIGTLEVRFVVSASGKVEQLRVISNSSNESFAACSVQAIMEAEIPPIPKELVPMLANGRIEIDYSFTILSN